MATENVRDLRRTLESVLRAVERTGEGVVIGVRDGQTELGVKISVADYERCTELTDPSAL